MGTEFYWTIVVAVGGACWAIMSTIRDRKAQAMEHSRQIIDRLLDGDHIIVEHPDIQQYLSATASEKEEHFRTPTVLADIQFFKSKSYVYSQLNLFDEILSAAVQTKECYFLLAPPSIIEIEDWTAYMKHRLAHPLYRSIMRNEAFIFGKGLQDFWNKNESVIVSQRPDIYSW